MDAKGSNKTSEMPHSADPKNLRDDLTLMNKAAMKKHSPEQQAAGGEGKGKEESLVYCFAKDLAERERCSLPGTRVNLLVTSDASPTALISSFVLHSSLQSCLPCFY